MKRYFEIRRDGVVVAVAHTEAELCQFVGIVCTSSLLGNGCVVRRLLVGNAVEIPEPGFVRPTLVPRPPLYLEEPPDAA